MIPDALHPLGRRSWRTAPPLPYDAEVEYLQSSGTQYIDTGILITDVRAIAFDVEFTARTSTTSERFLGSVATSDTGSSTAYKRLFATADVEENGISAGYLDRGNITGSRVLLSGYATNRRVTVPKLSCKAANDGTIVGKTLTIFRTTTGSGTLENATYAGRMRWYSLQVWGANETLIFDATPVRVGFGTSAVGYLYDRANPTGGTSGNGLYGNEGTGAFGVGPDKAAGA